MSVTIRPYRGRKGVWEVDFSLLFSDGTTHRERRKSPVSSKSASARWGQDLARELLANGPKKPTKEIPTLEEFSKTFMIGHPIANRHKPSSIAAQESIFRIHLIPFLGSKCLNKITNQDIQKLKGSLEGRSEKTANNILTTLNTALKKAVEWEVIDQMPCKVELLKVPDQEADYFDFDEYEALVNASQRMGAEEHLTILLGGDAGLRCGEIIALRWTDLNLPKRQIRVQRSDWNGHETDPKGRKTRIVPMTKRLAEALVSHQHLISDRVLCRNDGSRLSQKMVGGKVRRSCRLARIQPKGPHTLRHTFCSHLAMRGAPVVSIQELAGHKDLSTTMRYMHLSPKAIEYAIDLLEQRAPYTQNALGVGDI